MEKAPFLIVEQSCDIAMAQVMEQIASLGLQITTTFDLQQARQAHANCPCPHTCTCVRCKCHGNEKCDCQMVIVLIYGNGSRPATMVVHGHEGKTWFSFVETPQHHTSHPMETFLVHRLVSPANTAPSELS